MNRRQFIKTVGLAGIVAALSKWKTKPLITVLRKYDRVLTEPEVEQVYDDGWGTIVDGSDDVRVLPLDEYFGNANSGEAAWTWEEKPVLCYDVTFNGNKSVWRDTEEDIFVVASTILSWVALPGKTYNCSCRWWGGSERKIYIREA